jgi:hypothetical protein
MYTVFAFLTRLRYFKNGMPSLRSASPARGVASDLMESAEARAGLNPHQALELRRAAGAYLSVVR